jgi:SAM-dependent methyltransferase
MCSETKSVPGDRCLGTEPVLDCAHSKERRVVLREFLAANRRFCNKLKRHLPQAKTDAFLFYEELVARYMNSKRDQTVVDVGGGKHCSFCKYRDPDMGTKIVAVDISAEEMEHNDEVDEKRVADVTQSFPFQNGEVDLIVSSSVLEHLENLDGFVMSSRRALKDYGYSIHLLPCRFAPFALINQILPKGFSRKLLFFFFPERKGFAGFPAFYDKCYYSAIKPAFEKRGFEVVEMHLNYYQSEYFNFFVPLFVMSALYEVLLQAIGAKNLCAYIIIVARKKPVPSWGTA